MKIGGIKIPIVTTYDPKGSRRAQTGVQKFTSFATKAFDGLAIAAAGAAVKFGVDGVQAAIAAEKAEATFAKTLQNTTKATNKQIQATEKYITATQFATGVNDDDLRLSLSKLLVATKNTTKAQQLQALALDVSAGTGKSLSQVSDALTRAYNGQFTSLTRMGIKIDEDIVKAKDFTAVQKQLNEAFGGQAAAAADTTAGKLAIMNEKFGEMQEEIGFIILEGLEPLMDWVSSPAGGKALEDFMEAFGGGIKAAAEALPGILQGLKKIGGVASGLGIDPSSFMNPQMLAAATAFRLTPGPVQIKALAAVAAYAAFDQGTSSHDKNVLSGKLARTAIGSDKIDYGSYFEGTWSGAVAQGNYMYGQTGATKNTNAPQYQINISGAVDPEMTARQLQRILAQSKRRAGVY